MGTVELQNNKCVIYSNILLYGNAISEVHRANIQTEISSMWNEPQATVTITGKVYKVSFVINTWLFAHCTPTDIVENTNPKNNYFRIENTCAINISYVDGLGSNTGYFFAENLYAGATTAAHEYGHTLGLPHPSDLNIIGKGVPGIMYPRGTLVNPEYQYNPAAAPATNGGTLFPKYRKVLQLDIDNLGLNKLQYNNGNAILGAFSNVWHGVE